MVAITLFGAILFFVITEMKIIHQSFVFVCVFFFPIVCVKSECLFYDFTARKSALTEEHMLC